jgi:hypothetical protein
LDIQLAVPVEYERVDAHPLGKFGDFRWLLTSEKPGHAGISSDRAAAVRRTALGMQNAAPRVMTLLAT